LIHSHASCDWIIELHDETGNAFVALMASLWGYDHKLRSVDPRIPRMSNLQTPSMILIRRPSVFFQKFPIRSEGVLLCQRHSDLQTACISKLMLTKVLGHPVSVSTGALCRVCKVARFHASNVPDSSTTSAETHPELPWCSGILRRTCAKMSRLLRMLSLPVLHRALTVAANALPHQIGDMYGSSVEFNIRVAHVGLRTGHWATGTVLSHTVDHPSVSESSSTGTQLRIVLTSKSVSHTRKPT
jgi:hypothetical protein